MKKIILTLAFVLVQILTFAQAPAIQWQKNLGGINNDVAKSIQKTTDGGYIVAGYSNSNDNDVTENHGNSEADFWIAKLSATGTIQWQKSLGGTKDDRATSIQQTADGGYIVAGETNSNDGDVTGLHFSNLDPQYWQADFWIVKLSASGTLEWQKTVGGNKEDVAKSIQQTTDGGYVVVGRTFSIDGDINIPETSTIQKGGWIVKLDGKGIIQWRHLLSYYINIPPAAPYWYITDINSILQTADGGYMISGSALYYNGNEGNASTLVVKLTAVGVTEWYKRYPYSGWGDEAQSIQNTADGGYIVGGSAILDSGSPSQYYILKLDSAGTVIWKKIMGGSGEDMVYSIKQTLEGGYIVAGTTTSKDGDITSNHGQTDCWVVKLSTTGATEWQKTLGGSLDDYAYDILETASGEYVLAGSSSSIDGDLTGNKGNTDLWIVKLGAALSTTSFEKNSVKVYPNPAKNQINLQFPNQLKADKIIITDLTGKVIVEQTTNTTQVNVEKLATGLYLIQAFSGKQKFQSKLIKE